MDPNEGSQKKRRGSEVLVKSNPPPPPFLHGESMSEDLVQKIVALCACWGEKSSQAFPETIKRIDQKKSKQRR